MDSRPLYVSSLPADLHAYLEAQCKPGGAPNKAAALAALLREAQRLGLTVTVTAQGGAP